MEFNSYLFILAFLPCVILLYYILNLFSGFLGKSVIIVASILFIGYAKVEYLYFFIGSIILNYILSRILIKCRHIILKKIVFVAGIIGNVGILGFYKYVGFLFHVSIEGLIVPLGISFVTFSQLSFLVDAYRNELINHSLTDYIFWVLFFPKVSQGPIVKYNTVIKQLQGKIPDAEHIAKGLWFFAIGLGEKVLLADNLSNVVTYGYGFCPPFTELSGLESIIVILAYTLQIYFDFGGYSHMAVGIASLLGITLPDNFNRPYNATSVDDFWKRWHITLTSFLREYVYFPLGGSRKGTVRTYINIMIIFMISGIWHGANWTFIVWGLIHGVAMCVDRLIHKAIKHEPNIFIKFIGWVITFIYVNITWVFFRANSCKDAVALIIKAFTDHTYTTSEEFLECFKFVEYKYLERKIPILATWTEQFPALGMVVFLLICMIIALCRKDILQDFKPRMWKGIWIGIVILWSITSLSHVAQYIYGVF